MYASRMGLFSKKEKVQTTPKQANVVLVDLPYSDVLDSENFTDSTWQGKETVFRIVRISKIFPNGHGGHTHEAVVARANGTKEYNALLTVVDRKIVKCFVDLFYG